MVKKTYEGAFETRFGEGFSLNLYTAQIDYAEHIALVKGEISNTSSPVMVRMHAVNPLNDLLGGGTCDTLRRSIEIINENGSGVIVLLRAPNPRSLSERLLKEEQPKKSDTVLRDYGIGAQILLDLGVQNMVLLTDAPKSVIGLDGYDLHIQSHHKISEG